MRVSSKILNVLVEVVCFLFILLFSYAAVSKLLDFETFETQLGQSPLLSAYARPVAIGVPLLELLISFLLMLKRFRRIALFGFYGMMVMFTTYIVIILNFTDFVPCSCGGVLEALGWMEHLIFNVVFIVMAAGAILIFRKDNNKKELVLLAGLTIMVMAIVVLLFVFSEKKMHRNNAFQRRYIPHALEKIGEYDLEFNSYYISGISKDSIYLGNYGAPQFLKALDIKLNRARDFKVTITNTHLPYKRVVITVKPPYFYLGDGSVPVLFKGNIKDWKAVPISYNQAYFTQYQVADSLLFGLVTTSSFTESNALGLLNTTKGAESLKLDSIALKDSGKGKFETDGYLLWNTMHQKFIYLYYYKNRYEIFGHNLNYKTRGKTIDTISNPILDIAHHSKKNEYRLGGKSVVVNRQSATSGDFLYVHSDRLGQYESDKILNTASIVDIYNITDYSYSFSFYLFHQRDKKLKELQVYNELLIALIDDKLYLYKLKPAHFNADSNSTHTAQYQEKDRTPVDKVGR